MLVSVLSFLLPVVIVTVCAEVGSGAQERKKHLIEEQQV